MTDRDAASEQNQAQDDDGATPEPGAAAHRPENEHDRDGDGEDERERRRASRPKRSRGSKSRKSRGKQSQSKSERSAQALRPDGRERPHFLLDYPDDPELNRLVAAFESGNYAYVREHAERVAEQSDRAVVREAALELRRRIDPDPLIRYLLVASALLLVMLSAYAYTQHGGH